MTKATLLALAAFVLAPGMSAGPFQRRHVSAKATWVMHLDFEAMRRSSFGRHLLSKTQTPAIARHLQAAKNIYGVDFRTDLKDITLYGLVTRDSSDTRQHHGVAVFRGTFERRTFVNALKSRAGYTEVAFREHTLMKVIPADRKLEAGLVGHRVRTRTRPGWGVFYNADTFVMAETLTAIKTAVDVLDGKARTLVDANPFKHLAVIEKTPLFMAAANLDQVPGIKPRAAIFQGTKAISLALRENPADTRRPTATNNATIQVQTIFDGKSPEASEQLRQSFDGLVALALLNAEKEPLLAQLAGNIKIKQNDRTVTVDFSQRVDEAIKQMTKLEQKFTPVLRVNRPD